MWKQTRPVLVLGSLALNCAFVGVWLASVAISRVVSTDESFQPTDSASVWCPLHRQLKVSANQWKEIEPRLRAFRASADELSRQINELRTGIIDQVAAPNPDRAIIEAKQGEILANQRRMQGLVIDQLMTEKKVLMAEQQKRLFEMLRGATGCDQGSPMLAPGIGPRQGLGTVVRPASTH